MMDDIAADQKISLRVRQWFGFEGAKWVAVSLFFGLFYGPILPGLIRDWYENETFSYGFLIPFITGYLVWQRRVRLKSISLQPALWAGIPLFIALVSGLVGQAIGDMFSMRVSMILALASMIYLLLGREFFKALRFPLFYLALMIPIPYVLIKDLTYHLRYLDAAHAGNILRLIGIPVFVDAYFIHIPNMTLEVADVCSGVSSVFALFALGTVYAYFLPVRTSLKVLLVVCTFPFAMIANLIRIVVISALAYNFGAIVLQSTFHWLSGTTTFSLALVMLISTGELLRRRFPLLGKRELSPARIETDLHTTRTSASKGWLSHAIALSVLIVSLLLSNALGSGRKIHLESDLRLLVNLDTVELLKDRPEDLYQDSNADAVLSLVGTVQDQALIEVFIGYRGEQMAGTRLGSPKIMFPERWNSVSLQPATIPVSADSAIQANWMLTRKGTAERLVMYWYQTGEETFSGDVENRIHQIRRALFERRTDGAVVRIATPLVKGEPIDRAQERLSTLAKVLYPQLVKILPK